MRSPAARLTCSAAALIVVLGAAVLVIHFEQQLSARRTSLRAFDVVAREASTSLSTLRASEQAYVAPGQGLGFWMSTVDGLLESASSRVRELEQLAVGPDSRASIAEAAKKLDELRGLDKRVRQYVHSDQALMAADVIFSEAGEAAATASRKIETARQSEYSSWDEQEAAVRVQQLYTAAVAGGLCLVAISILMWPPAARQAGPSDRFMTSPVPVPSVRQEQSAAQTESAEARPAAVNLPVSPELPRETVPVLKAAVDLCTELNRVREIDDLTRLLGRAAQVMDASGLVVWVSGPGGTTLRPVLAHGYSAHALSRMPHVPRSGDNAAAAAYRTGLLQIVLTRPGVSGGAIAAPMIAPTGCIGALTAEIKNGSETSDGIQALAAIVAAQLAGVLADSIIESAEDEAPESRIASA